MWIVIEVTEGEDVLPWMTGFASLEEAWQAVRQHHAELWGSAEMGMDDPDLILTMTMHDGSQHEATLCDDDTDWPRWVISRVETEGERASRIEDELIAEGQADA